ncbi:MAG: type I-C CRISPR-associated protein Cas8c/Csd1 [Polyangiaceae bacterium]|nr:type I-C CRISPR-associated protein Cas8c/Csd1 [Polyangiaceae bacterium]
MMLQALVAYADREGLGDLDFEKRAVDYELRIAADGAFVGLVPLTENKRRTRLSGLPIGPTSKNNPGYPSFLVDNAQYVLGTAKKDAKAGNAEKCFESYVVLTAEAAGATHDPALLALRRFLERPPDRALADAELARLEDKKADQRGDRVLVPVLDSDAAARMHERPGVIAWWRQRRTTGRQELAAGPLGRCLVTGELAPVARTHPALKGPPFPGTGAKLVAYDKDAFTSQDLEQGANAPMSEAAALKYVAALNALLEKDAQGRRSSALDLDDESAVVFWTRDESDAPMLLLDVLAPPSRGADAVHHAESVWRGSASRAFDPTPFYAVTLGVNSARVVVRDWVETTARAVVGNLERWFQDLQLGEATAEALPLVEMLRALQATPAARGDKRGLAPGLATRVFRAAVQGAPLPRALLVAATQRLRVPPREREDGRFVLRARVAVIKAVLCREGMEVPVALDESNTDRAYLLGRLFAALEKLQLVASKRGNDLNATIRDRYYGAASSTPAAVFGRLLSLSMHHASKTKDDGLGIVAERAKAGIMNRLAAKPFPKTLSLSEQGLFAVGYYHQREAFFAKKETADDGPKA